MLAEYVAEYIRRLDAEAELRFRLIAYYRNSILIALMKIRAYGSKALQ